MHTDAAIAVVVWIPLLIEIIIINAIVLAYKKFIDNTNRWVKCFAEWEDLNNS